MPTSLGCKQGEGLNLLGMAKGQAEGRRASSLNLEGNLNLPGNPWLVNFNSLRRDFCHQHFNFIIWKADLRCPEQLS